MFETIGDRYGIDLREAHLVGDSLRDLQAGAAAGCKPHFVQTGKAARLDAAELAAVQSAVPAGEGARRPRRLRRTTCCTSERIERGDAAEPDSVFGVL